MVYWSVIGVKVSPILFAKVSVSVSAILSAQSIGIVNKPGQSFNFDLSRISAKIAAVFLTHSVYPLSYMALKLLPHFNLSFEFAYRIFTIVAKNASAHTTFSVFSVVCHLATSAILLVEVVNTCNVFTTCVIFCVINKLILSSKVSFIHDSIWSNWNKKPSCR